MAELDVQYISDQWFIFVARKLCVVDIPKDPNDILKVYLEVLCVRRQKTNLCYEVGVLFQFFFPLFSLIFRNYSIARCK